MVQDIIKNRNKKLNVKYFFLNDFQNIYIYKIFIDKRVRIDLKWIFWRGGER